MNPIFFVGKEWNELIGHLFNMENMINLGSFIKKEREKYVVFPDTPRGVFNVFKNVSPQDIRVVIVGQDPYHDGSYDGRAFSNSKDNGKISPSLRNILKEIEEDIYDGFNLNQNPNLKRLEQQGVFLINRVLTVKQGEPNSHANIGWEDFTDKVFKVINDYCSNVVFMLWGANAKTIKPLIDIKKHYVLESGHPSPMSANRGHWFGNKHFSKANKFLSLNGKQKIIW